MNELTSPGEKYSLHCKTYGLVSDPAQQKVLKSFDRIWRLVQAVEKPLGWRRFFRGGSPVTPIVGLYLWGGVGRGKTMLMDIFYNSLVMQEKKRQHFHSFMLDIHKALKKRSEKRDPLPDIAKSIARQTKVLCLDEFHVNDITDAMLLGRLLAALFSEGVVLVATSNIQPEDLYADGLQRARFIPAINLIKTQTEVVELCGKKDFRLALLRKEGTYHYPLNSENAHNMRREFDAIASHTNLTAGGIEVNDRMVPVLGQAEGAIWFEFSDLCDSPRSNSDYIEIARQYHSVFISDIPVLDDTRADAVRRLLNMLDIFYDHRIKLVVSADAEIRHLYIGERLAFEFQRAISRLIEMQSKEYLEQAHRTQGAEEA